MIDLWLIVILFPLDNQEQRGKNNCHHLGNYNGNPNTVNLPNDRQKDNGSRLKKQRSQEGDNCGGESIVEGCEKP